MVQDDSLDICRERGKKSTFYEIYRFSFTMRTHAGGALRFIGIDIYFFFCRWREFFESSHSTLSFPSFHIQFFKLFKFRIFLTTQENSIIFFFLFYNGFLKRLYFFFQILFSVQHVRMPSVGGNCMAWNFVKYQKSQKEEKKIFTNRFHINMHRNSILAGKLKRRYEKKKN